MRPDYLATGTSQWTAATHTAISAQAPRSGLERSDFVLWPMAEIAATQ